MGININKKVLMAIAIAAGVLIMAMVTGVATPDNVVAVIEAIGKIFE